MLSIKEIISIYILTVIKTRIKILTIFFCLILIIITELTQVLVAMQICE